MKKISTQEEIYLKSFIEKLSTSNISDPFIFLNKDQFIFTKHLEEDTASLDFFRLYNNAGYQYQAAIIYKEKKYNITLVTDNKKHADICGIEHHLHSGISYIIDRKLDYTPPDYESIPSATFLEISGGITTTEEGYIDC